MSKNIKNRLKELEKKEECKPPFDLIDKYYDELQQEDKVRYWRYWYGDTYSLQEAELLELNYISHTLHFKCDVKPSDIPLPELDAWEASIMRMEI